MRQMKIRAQSFLKEKKDEREKWDKFYFARIRETVLSAYIKYFLQKLVLRHCFVHKHKSETVMPRTK